MNIKNFFKYCFLAVMFAAMVSSCGKGEDGIDGKDGTDGCEVTIGANGNWYVCGVDQGKSALGSRVTIGTSADGPTKDGFWLIDGELTNPPVKAKLDFIFTIEEDGFLYVNGVKTEANIGSSVYIDKDGNLWVGGVMFKGNFTVTYYSDGGGNVAPENVISGGKARGPKDPTKDLPEPLMAGLYVGSVETLPSSCVFQGWYEAEVTEVEDAAPIVTITGKVPFDFDKPIIGNLALKAKWAMAEKVELPEGTQDILTKTVTYILANRGEYTLLLDDHVAVPAILPQLNSYENGTATNAAFLGNLKLSLIGLGQEQVISWTVTGNKFTIIADAHLILGNNITLKCGTASGSNSRAVYVNQGGILTMLDGSKIVDQTANQINMPAVTVAATCVASGTRSTFNMKGGEISGISVTIATPASALIGGVLVQNNGRVYMSGGKIKGNFSTFPVAGSASDIFVMDGGTLNLSRNAEVGSIVLNGQPAPSNTFINIGENYSGTVDELHFRIGGTSAPTVGVGVFENKQIIIPGTKINMFNAALGQIRGTNSPNTVLDISATHQFNNSGVLVAKE